MKLTKFEQEVYDLITIKPENFSEIELEHLAINNAIKLLHMSWAEIVKTMIAKSKRMKR